MTRRFQLAGLPFLAAVTLSACVSVAPPSPLLTHAQSQLQTLRTDPTVVRWAPDELAQAEQAVKDAQQAHGDAQHVKYLAFMANTQVQIAKASANAKREEAAYKALVAKRDTLGGGNSSITTLSQNVLGSGNSQATPINQEEQAETPVAAQPVPAPVASNTPSASAPGPSVPIAAPTETPLPSAASPAPAENVPASVAPEAAANGALLTLAANDFTRDGHLTPVARNAVHALLSRLVQHPSRQVVISGASRAQLDAVRKALAETGVPGWRLRTQSAPDHSVSIDFGGEVSTPALRR